MKNEERDIRGAETAGQGSTIDPNILAVIQATTKAVMASILPLLRQQGAQRPALPSPKMKRKAESRERTRVKALINIRCQETGEDHEEVTRWIYSRFIAAGHEDPRPLAKTIGKGASGFDILDAQGKMGRFLDVVQGELPRKPAALPLPLAPQRPPRIAVAPILPHMQAALDQAKLTLAGLVHGTGLAPATIDAALRGRLFGKKTLVLIASALGKTPAELWPAPGQHQEAA